MRVCFIERFLDLELGGGSMYSLDVLCRALQEEGHEVAVLTIDPANNKIPLGTEKLPYRIIERRRSLAPLHISEFIRELEKEFDVFHITDPALAPYAAKYKKAGGKAKVVSTLNCYFFCTNFALMDGKCHASCDFMKRIQHENVSPTRKFTSAPTRLLQSVLWFPDIVHLDRLYPISKASMKIFAEYGIPNEKMHVITEMFDYAELRRSKNRSFCRNGKKLLFIGRLIAAKGVSTLISALELHPKEVMLTICGNGPEMEQLKSIVEKKKLSSRVTFKGHVPHSEIWEYLNSHDLFVHPAIFPEPFGRTIPEALYCGIPVLVSNIGAPPEIIGTAGKTFRSGDAQDLAEKVSVLLGDTAELEKLSAAGMKRAEGFSCKNVIEDYITEYESLLE